MTRLYPLFSGSSGNCYYIGSAENGILIDAGRSARQIETALLQRELDIKNVRAIFVTHEHSDHISGLRVLASRYRLPVYATCGTIEALREKGCINEKVNASVLTEGGTEAGGMNVRAFRISHDCTQGCGYVVETPDGRKTAFATDTGMITDEISESLTGCDTVVIESNHDIRMLENGPYPYILKKRILSEYGHLSNDDCADTAVKLIRSGTTRILLAHLSRENNIPVLAEQTSVCAFEGEKMKRNIDYMLTVVGENGCGGIIY